MRRAACSALQIGCKPEACAIRALRSAQAYIRNVRVGVLGPLEVRAEGQQIDIAGPIPRRLLALLTTRPGRFVSVDALIDGLWGDDPPAAARSTLQSHVARLRRSLGVSGAIVAGPAGYRLAVDAADVDAFSFVTAVQEGHRRLADGDPAAAAAALSAGLAWWRGPAFAEFRGCAALEAEAVRLEQLRLDAVEWRIEAELASGACAPPVGELEGLVREHPAREGFWALLMRALYRAGRQADALAAYRRARRALVDELGVEPGRQLREAERLVLAHDPSLDPPASAPGKQAAVPAPEPQQPLVTEPAVQDQDAVPPAQTEPAAERRMVVVAVLELPGGAADPEEVAAQNRAFREHVRDRVVAHGGVVCADTGGTSVAIFGAPVAHEDDAVRAVRAAKAVARDWPGTPAPRAGVSAGEVVVTGEVPTGGVSGLPVTEADRLRTLAQPGDLVVDEPVRELIGPADAEPVSAAGAPAWRLIRLPARGAASAATRFVGRGRDLAMLLAAFYKTTDDRVPQLVTILGEPGIGKSRLVAELRWALEAQGGEVVWRIGYCRPYGDGTSLSALADIVKAQAGVTDTDATATAVAKIRAALPDDERGNLEPRLTPLIGVDPGVTPSRFESFAAWRRFIEIIAERAPAVLVVEDLHWAAPMLLDFLEDLVAGLSEVPVLLLATARPELLDARPGWGAGTAGLRLSPLPEQDVAAMLDALLGSVPNGRRRRELVTRCGGVPLYAEQFAQLASQQSGAAVPPTLAAVIGARLDTLSREHRAVLQTAAVAGSPFWADEVGVLTGAPAHAVTAALGALVRRQFLRRVNPSTRAGQAEFAFWHDLVRDAAEARLTRLDRAGRHLAVAQWWAADARERSGEFADLIAHHAGIAYDLATAAGDTDLAAQARGPACEAAAAAGARLQGIDTPGALRLLARALELSGEDSPLRARILGWYGAALFDDRQFGRAEQVLTEAVQQLERLNDPLRVDAIMFLFATLFALGHDFGPATSAALRAAETLPPSRAAVRNLATLAMAELVGQSQQSLRNAIGFADRAIRIAADHGTAGDAFAHVVRGRARLSLGDGEGMDELEAGLDDVLRYETGTFTVATRMWFAGALHHWRGPAAELKARQELEALAASRGLEFITSMSIAEDVRVLYELGRFGEAIALAEQIREEDVEAQLRWGAVQRALLLLDTGALDDATVDAVQHIPPADQGDLRHILGVALVRSAAAIRHDHAAEAVALLREVGDPQRFTERDGAVELLPRLVRTAIAAGCPQTVTGLRDIAAVPTPLRSQIAATVAGLIEEIHGRPAAAAGHLRGAASGWEALDYRVEAAFSHADFARNLRAAGDPAARSATEHAQSLCEELGVVPLLHVDG
jgi:DNA-binding SARP family transcriptional activator/class 3 adenylate cyclase/tetratricopeptide (TPR) repeat protein